MAMKKLGRGLDALLGDFTATPPEGVVQADIYMIDTNADQPRKTFDEERLNELAESLKRHGMVQPIIVHQNGDRYTIVAGERRFRAARLAGFKTVPVIVKQFDDAEIQEIALVENLQRENLNPIEEAQAYKRLLNEFRLKQDEVAERVSKSRTAVTNSMRLLKLCDEVQQMIINGMISTGHARALIGIEDPEEQYNIAQKIFDEKLSVRDVEKLVKNIGKPSTTKLRKPNETDKSLEIIYQDIEDRLKEKLSTKVSISGKGNGAGKIEIEFYNHDDLDKLVDMLTRQN